MSQSKKILSYIKYVIDFLTVMLGYFSIFLVLYYIVKISKGQFHSDCTDTIMWAQAALDGGSLMNKDFCYAGLMPFGGSLLMLPFVAMFGVSVKAQIFGMTIFFVIFTLAVIFFVRSCKLEFNWVYIMLAGVLYISSASDKLREIFWEHIIYYSLGVLFMLVGLGIVLRCISSESKHLSERELIKIKKHLLKKTASNVKKTSDNNNLLEYHIKKYCVIKYIKWHVILLIFTALTAMNGVQSLTMYGLPVLAAVFAERFFDFGKHLADKKNAKRYITMSVMIAGIVCGLLLGRLVNSGIKAGYAEAYSSFSNSSDWVQNFLSIFPQYFSLLGVKVKTTMVMYSFQGIRNLLRIIFALILMIVPVIMALMYQKFHEISYKLMIWVYHFMSLFILLGWVFGKLNSAEWRLSPMVITSVILCVMFARWIFKNMDYRRIVTIFVIPFLCMVVMIASDIAGMNKKPAENKDLQMLEQYLEESNLEYGYATFWQANVITMLSDSKVKIRGITIDEDGYKVRYYQTNRKWYGDATGYDQYFVVFTSDEYSRYYRDDITDCMISDVINCGQYTIVVYEENIFR